MTALTYRYVRACGHRGRWLRDPNGAVADGERHLGVDRARRPCRDTHTSVSALRLETRDRGQVVARRPL